MFQSNVYNTCFRKLSKERKRFACVIDQFDAQPFNKNAAGWPSNTISQLARAQSQSEYDSIMKRLVELKNEGGLPDDIKIDDAINQIKPRWCQSPNEIEQFVQMTNGNVMSKLTEAYEKSVKDSTPESVSEKASVEQTTE